MLFFDCLYGPITLRSRLFTDLVHTPEFQRLRTVRMLNVDTPICKDLSTASRFAHTVGVCHLAERLAHLHQLSVADQNAIISAAVLHDMGIPPLGHLIEQMFDEIDPPFDHESIARQIVEGTYAPENKYHQIYAGRTLQVGAVLDKHGVSRERVFELLEPRRYATVIVGAIDLDNIDNVLRMATLLGLGSFRDLAYRLASSLEVASTGQVQISARAGSAASDWLRLRARCYEIMMYPRAGIAYAALVHDLAEAAVRNGIIKKDEWFLTDDKLMRRLLDNDATASLAEHVPLPVSWTREGDTQIAPPREIVDPDATERSRFITHAAIAAARAAAGV